MDDKKNNLILLDNKFHNGPMGHQLTVHLMNLRASGFSNEYIAKFIVEMQPELTRLIVNKTKTARSKKKA
jgi:hypothetical protein